MKGLGDMKDETGKSHGGFFPLLVRLAAHVANG